MVGLSFGDSIFILDSTHKVTLVKLEDGKYFGLKSIPHRLIQRYSFGSKLNYKNDWCILLRPSPYLFCRYKRTVTATIRFKDAASICSLLDLKPGSKVLECGTGSGRLSYAILQSIAPNGELKSFEINEKCAEYVLPIIESFGYSSIFSITIRDVCLDGFLCAEYWADAIVLDLPSPCSVLENAKQCLKNSGRIVCYVPVIGTLQDVVDGLLQLSFTDIQCFEFSNRVYNVPISKVKHPQRKQAVTSVLKLNENYVPFTSYIISAICVK
ncbi:MAG: tRNA (adenine(58)-N(1))-methyltransferase catalytic subunit trmt61a [Marteilia pararefringens]